MITFGKDKFLKIFYTLIYLWNNYNIKLDRRRIIYMRDKLIKLLEQWIGSVNEDRGMSFGFNTERRRRLLFWQA
jgi:hypothetical protein